MITAHYSIPAPLLLVSGAHKLAPAIAHSSVPPRRVAGALGVLEAVKHNSRREERCIPNGWAAAWTFPKGCGKNCYRTSAIRLPRQARGEAFAKSI